MTAGKKATLGTGAVLALLTGYVALVSEPTGVHICGRELCGGDLVISSPQPPGKSVLSFVQSGERVLYVSNATCKRDLYSVLASGGPVTMVSNLIPAPDPLSPLCFRNVVDGYHVSPDGLWASYEADRDTDQQYELYTVSVLGGPVVRVSPPAVFDHDVERHRWSPDSARIALRWGKDSNADYALYSALPRTQPHGPASMYLISQPPERSKDVAEQFTVGHGYAVYGRNDSTSGVYVKYGTTVVPPGNPVPCVFCDGFESGNTGEWR